LRACPALQGWTPAIGALPFSGAVADFYRSNSCNLKIVHKHRNKHHPGSRLNDAWRRRRSAL
jgi:hypothetical protein